MPIDRVFVDTSVLFSAVRSGRGYARELVEMGIDGRVDLFVSDVVIDETRRNLRTKGSTADEGLLDSLASLGILRRVSPHPDLVDDVARVIEFKDAPIVAGAMAAEAAMLATFDHKHLLSRAEIIRSLFGVSVMRPGEVVRSLATGH